MVAWVWLFFWRMDARPVLPWLHCFYGHARLATHWHAVDPNLVLAALVGVLDAKNLTIHLEIAVHAYLPFGFGTWWLNKTATHLTVHRGRHQVSTWVQGRPESVSLDLRTPPQSCCRVDDLHRAFVATLHR